MTVSNTRNTRNTRNTGKAKSIPTEWDADVSAYLRHLAAKAAPKTTIGTRRQQLAQAARALAPLAPGDVTLDALTDYLAAQPWAAETLRGHRNALHAFFQWRYRTGRAPSDPTENLPAVPASSPAPRPTPDRIVKATMTTTVDPRSRLMLRIACELGLRRAEVAGVNSRDVVDGDTGAMLRVIGKGAKLRLVPISDELAGLLEQGPRAWDPDGERGGFVFPGRDGGHLSPRYVGELCAEALPGDWTMHSLRHRFATRAYRGTRNLRAVQELLGHTSVATTQRYTAVDEDELRAAMRSAA